VRRVRRRKIVEYLVKWKGYPEEEITWVDEMDVHEDLIKEYKSASVPEP
jgi:Chromo (CHRromatin Organisation MOdifier) domain